MPHSSPYTFLIMLFSAWLLGSTPSFATEPALALREVYAREVDRQLAVPQDEQRFYAARAIRELQQAKL